MKFSIHTINIELNQLDRFFQYTSGSSIIKNNDFNILDEAELNNFLINLLENAPSPQDGLQNISELTKKIVVIKAKANVNNKAEELIIATIFHGFFILTINLIAIGFDPEKENLLPFRLFLRICDENTIIDILKCFPDMITEWLYQDNNLGQCTLMQCLALEGKTKVITHIKETILDTDGNVFNGHGESGYIPLQLAILERQESTTIYLAHSQSTSLKFRTPQESPYYKNANDKDALELAFDHFPRGVDILLSTKQYKFDRNSPHHPLTRAWANNAKPELLAFVLPHYIKDWEANTLRYYFTSTEEGQVNDQNDEPQISKKDTNFLKRAFYDLGLLATKEELNAIFKSLCRQQIFELLPLADFILDIADYYIKLGANFGIDEVTPAFLRTLPFKFDAEKKFKSRLIELYNLDLIDILKDSLQKIDKEKNFDIYNLIQETRQKFITGKIDEKIVTLERLLNWLKNNKPIISLFSSFPSYLIEPIDSALVQLKSRFVFYQATLAGYDLKTSSVLLKFPMEESTEETVMFNWLKEVFEKEEKIYNSKQSFENKLKFSQHISYIAGSKLFSAYIPVTNEDVFDLILGILMQHKIVKSEVIDTIYQQYEQRNASANATYVALLNNMTDKETQKLNWQEIQRSVEADSILLDKRYTNRDLTLAHLAVRDEQIEAFVAFTAKRRGIVLIADTAGNLPLHTMISRRKIKFLEVYLSAYNTDTYNQLWYQLNGSEETPYSLALADYKRGKPEALRLYIKYTGNIPNDFIQLTYELVEKEARTLPEDKRVLDNYVPEAIKLIRGMLDDVETLNFKIEKQLQIYLNGVLTCLCQQKTTHPEAVGKIKDLINDYIYAGATCNSTVNQLPAHLTSLFNNHCYQLSLYLIKINDALNLSNSSRFFIDPSLPALSSNLLEFFKQLRKAILRATSVADKANKILDVVSNYQCNHTTDPDEALTLIKNFRDSFRMGNSVKSSRGLHWEQDKGPITNALVIDLTPLDRDSSIKKIMQITLNHYYPDAAGKVKVFMSSASKSQPAMIKIIIDAVNGSTEQYEIVTGILEQFRKHGFIDSIQQAGLAKGLVKPQPVIHTTIHA